MRGHCDRHKKITRGKPGLHDAISGKQNQNINKYTKSKKGIKPNTQKKTRRMAHNEEYYTKINQ
jgi:hypothetical protein